METLSDKIVYRHETRAAKIYVYNPDGSAYGMSGVTAKATLADLSSAATTLYTDTSVTVTSSTGKLSLTLDTTNYTDRAASMYRVTFWISDDAFSTARVAGTLDYHLVPSASSSVTS